MKIDTLSSTATISRQWLGELVDRGAVPGVRRKQNGRLEVFDVRRARRWANRKADCYRKSFRIKPRDQRPFNEYDDWVAKGRTRESREARATVLIGLSPGLKGGIVTLSIGETAKQCGISRQALHKALKTLCKHVPRYRPMVLRGHHMPTNFSRHNRALVLD